MTHSSSRHLSSVARLLTLGVALTALTHCGGDERAGRFGAPTLHDQTPPEPLPDAAAPEEELDASAPATPDAAADTTDDFVKYWDGSTTPTADHVRHVDAGNVDTRGAP